MGPVGPPGPAGAGDLSGCEYEEKATKNHVRVSVSTSAYITERPVSTPVRI